MRCLTWGNAPVRIPPEMRPMPPVDRPFTVTCPECRQRVATEGRYSSRISWHLIERRQPCPGSGWAVNPHG